MKIFIAVPSYDGRPFARTASCIFRAMLEMQVKGIHADLNFLDFESLVTRARMNMTAQFLASDSTHLLWVDSDLEWEDPGNVILSMLAADKEVIGGVYPCKAIPSRWPMNFGEVSPDDLPHDPDHPWVLEVKDCPTGFMLIKREAIIRLIEAYPNLRCKIRQGGWDANPDIYALFDTSIDIDGMYLSEDFHFCRLWQKIGGRAWVYANIRFTHYGTWGFTGCFADAITRHPDEKGCEVTA